MNRLLVSLVAVLTPALAFAQLNFPGGNVPAGTTWGVPGLSQTVTLNGDVTIPAGVTLTILPGTTITAAATDNIMRAGGTNLVDLFVEGSLVVQEMAGQESTFTGPTSGAASWGGFIVSAGATVQAGSTRFQRMSQGLRATSATLTLNNVTFSTSTACLSVAGTGTTTTIAGSTFAGCATPALTVSGSTVNVSSSIIRDTTNTTAAVNVSAGTVTIDRSTLAYNAGIGVLSSCGSTGSISVTNSI
ncbi:MAG: hypothetical protein JNJ54_23110, partial [Myxococcaceae bacterium]|nr:hypothetical protein [Myxococcaceae bacterium]